MFQLSDILGEVECLKEDPKYDIMMSYFDSSVGISPIVSKLLYNIQEKWTTRANNFKKTHGLIYPRFWVFTEFIHEQAKVRNDPGFIYSQGHVSYFTDKPQSHNMNKRPVIACKMIKKDVKIDTTLPQGTPCYPIYKTTKHLLDNCRFFLIKAVW